MNSDPETNVDQVAKGNRRLAIMFAVLFGIPSLIVVFYKFGGFDYLRHERLKREGMIVAAATLNDPATAQFRNVYVVDYLNVVCGEINGKNLYGAYTGFSKFHVREGKAELEPTPRIELNDDMKIVNMLEKGGFDANDAACRR